ncbi:MAG: alpha/beta fold hydrolase [Hyphomicrobiaceae bacterium]
MQHYNSAMASSTPAIALHCSGAGAGQWRQLAEALGPEYRLAAPEHYGCEHTGPWTGTHAFTLADEAAKIFDLIDRSEEKIHLIGHSYGGGVALHVALARPNRIASLTLYEPSAFHILRAMGDRGAAAFAEIVEVVRQVGKGVMTGDYRGAAIAFVDYWGGAGAWAALRPSVQAALVRWMPKAPLDFHALMEEEPTPPAAYAGLHMPVLLMRGEHAPQPTRLIAEALAKLLPAARPTVVDGAGHMGPLTHAPAVNASIAAHIGAAETAIRHRCQEAAIGRQLSGGSYQETVIRRQLSGGSYQDVSSR